MIVILIYELAVADPHVPNPLYSPTPNYRLEWEGFHQCIPRPELVNINTQTKPGQDR